MFKLNNLQRLKISFLLFGMMFFYGIEQVFMNKYLHNNAARGYVTMFFIMSMVVFDVPAGVIADRFGRKLCMLLAAVAQATSVVVLGLSNSLLIYLLGCVLFGLFIALLNGASQALLYDWLASQFQTKLYAKHQGSIYAFFLIGAAIANFASGFIARTLGLRSTYFLSVIPALLAFMILLGLKESALTRKASFEWFSHLSEVLQEIGQHKRILVYALRFTAAAITLMTIGEFGQVYLLSFGISTITLGAAWAITALFAACGRYTAHYFQAHARNFIAVYCFILALFVSSHHLLGIALFWLVYGLNESISNVAETEIQDETTAPLRATTFSVISVIGNIIAIPIVYLFTKYYVHHGIGAANQMIAITMIVVLLLTIVVRQPPVADSERRPQRAITERL